MKYFYLLIIALTAALLNPAVAQPIFPENGPLYSDDGVARIDITINPDTLAWLYKPENQQSDIEYRAEFVFDNGTLRDTIHEIGFRLRGNTSRASAKKSFKVSFNRYQSGRKYFGVEKLNLNGEHNDPTVARAKISWELCRNAGIPASRASFVRVYINGNYHGLYISVEHIDEEFVEKRWGSDGNLYKCLYPADLNYLGNDPDLYKFTAGDRRAYELKTNKVADDYSGLAHFIDVLNNTPIADLPCELEKVFNVQDYLKVVAMDVMTANWDGYIFNKNNFYLYDDPATGRFEYIPYDLDNTYGIDWFGINWSMRNIYNWGHDSEYRPLYERLMQVPEYRDWFSYYVSQISALMSPSPFFERLEVIKNQNYPFIVNDPYYPLDYGYTPANFLSAFTNGTGAHVPMGITEFVTIRRTSAANQLQLNNIRPIVNYLAATHNGAGGNAWIEATVTDDDPVEVALLYQINNGDWQATAMAAEGNDNRFSLQVNLPEGQSVVNYQISAADTYGHTTIYPCDPKTMIISPASGWPLFINELLASNATGITDEAGEYEDWLEIYNAGDDPIWLGDKYLSDNFANPAKWPMPDYTIQPGEFLLVWCDEDQEQGMFHTNFKLSKGGEELGIFDAESTGFAPIDTLTFPAQETDISYGRLPDGYSFWKYFEFPTPGISNLLSDINDQPTAQQAFYGFPNPVKGNTIYLNQTSNLQIIDMRGKLWMDEKECSQVSIAILPPGIYLLKTSQGGVFKLVRQ